MKNRKQQIIPMSKSLTYILVEYLKYRKGEAADYLFCDTNGQKLSDNALQSSIRRYNNSRGVIKTSMHQFRHTFAKKWILNGGDIRRLQEILNHSTLDMVKEYLNICNDDLKRDFDSFNPLENIYSQKKHISMKK